MFKFDCPDHKVKLNDYEVSFHACLAMMTDWIREEICGQYDTNEIREAQRFLDEYCICHFNEYDMEFCI